VVSVLVVDDSVVVRRAISDAISQDRNITVIGTAANGQIALSKVESLKPDVVTLDIEMPVMDGLTALRELRKRYPRLPIIMYSTLTSAGAAATLEALAAGASDYVTKPTNSASLLDSLNSVRDKLVPLIHALAARAVRRPGPAVARPTPVRRAPAARPAGPAARVDVLAVGSSTGGPEALAKVLAKLPADLPVPVVVVQHMPTVFTKMFAERLDRTVPLHVVEAAADMRVTPGTVYIAPGGLHLEVVRRADSVVTRIHTGPPEHSCRPAVDVLFRSVARVYGPAVVATVLTGMGYDGRSGCAELAKLGAEIIVQDEASSVVWGMPGAVAEAGLADAVLPLNAIADHLLSRTATDRATRVGGATW
jgi:two-component system, chemotaxis family, protein-glutamate methylesterase/glutaminase